MSYASKVDEELLVAMYSETPLSMVQEGPGTAHTSSIQKDCLPDAVDKYRR